MKIFQMSRKNAVSANYFVWTNPSITGIYLQGLYTVQCTRNFLGKLCLIIDMHNSQQYLLNLAGNRDPFHLIN